MCQEPTDLMVGATSLYNNVGVVKQK